MPTRAGRRTTQRVGRSPLAAMAVGAVVAVATVAMAMLVRGAGPRGGVLGGGGDGGIALPGQTTGDPRDYAPPFGDLPGTGPNAVEGPAESEGVAKVANPSFLFGDPTPAPSTALAPQDVTGGGAILVVETEPAGGEVFVDGQPVGRTPLMRDDLRPGERDIELRLADHVPERLAGRALEDGVVLNVSHTFVRASGRLTVTSTPSGAWVELGRRRLTQTTPVTLDALPAGEVTLLVGVAAHEPAKVVARVPMEGVGRLEVELAPWAAGDVLRDCARCPLMVEVPAGSFVMGSPDSEEGRHDHEGPVHEVTITRPFALGMYEVTFAEWDACASAGGCGDRRPADEGWGRESRPAVNLSWRDARDYVEWLSDETGEEYRLPTEAEWEYAARAGTETSYSWGDALGENRANCDGCGSRWDDGRTAPVGSFAANAWGLHDMHGNVWEWTEDCWNEAYSSGPNSRLPTDGSAWLSGDCDKRLLRGGSWYSFPNLLRSAARLNNSIGLRNNTTGFRVARTLVP